MAKIQPGLERITALLGDAAFPWRSIHVAGTNGKGSVCHYASSMLVGRNIKVGKFMSPHLVYRWDCITINGKPMEESRFRTVERHLLQVNKKLSIGASPFEILTAAAFTHFNDQNVKVGVVEVGMGGTLDSTNILNNQAISVITKIARDHQDFLGTTLAEIARHKAGILRPDVPYIINAANEVNVQSVIDTHAVSIGAGPRLLSTSFELQKRLYDSSKWRRLTHNLLPFQQENLSLAVVAVSQTLKHMEERIRPLELAKTLLLNTSQHHAGRQEFVHATPVFKEATHKKNHILVDGAHNPDAGQALTGLVHINQRFGTSPTTQRPETGWPVTWVLAMTQGKDARAFLASILEPGDRVVTTTFAPVDGMPWVKPMDPKELLEVAKSIHPDIVGVHVPVIGALRALCTAKYLSNQMAPWAPITLTGSLYLVGDLHRELRPRALKTWWTDPSEAAQADREAFLEIQAEERKRADAVMESKEARVSKPEDSASAERVKLQDELEALGRNVQRLDIEEQRLLKDQSMLMDMQDGEQVLSAVERLEHEDRRFAELHSTPEQIAAFLERAEKAKISLARTHMKLEIANKERQEKKEKALAQKVRREGRRDRKLERRRVAKEEKLQRRWDGLGPGYGEIPKWLYTMNWRDVPNGPTRGWLLANAVPGAKGPKKPPKKNNLSFKEFQRQSRDSDRPPGDSDRPPSDFDRPPSDSDLPSSDSDLPSRDALSSQTGLNKVLSFSQARADAGIRTWGGPNREARYSQTRGKDMPSFPRAGSNASPRQRPMRTASPEDELLSMSNQGRKNSFFGGSDSGD